MPAADWRCVQDISIGVEGLGFDSRAGQIGHSAATAAAFLWSSKTQAVRRGDESRHSSRFGVMSRVYRRFDLTTIFPR